MEQIIGNNILGKDCEEKFSKFFSAAKQYYTMQGFQISFLIIKDLMLSSEKLLDKIKVLDCLDGKYEEVLSGLSTQFYKQIDVIEEMVKEDQEYKKASQDESVCIHKMDELIESKEMWEQIDEAFCAMEKTKSQYARICYCRGYLDSLSI